jgi:hypothetical protein
MDFGQAFTFVFDDEDWIKKIGLGGLLSLIPIVGWLVVMGWGVEITKRVINKDAEVLPNWDDFGGYLTRGFMVFLVAFVFLLPVTILSGCSAGLTAFADSYSEDALLNAAWVITSCISCVVFLYSIAAYLILPAAIGKYAVSDELGEAFKIKEIYSMVRDNLGTYGLVLLGGLVSSLVASLGTIACFIGVLFTMVYAMAINGHLWGQAYNVSKSGATKEPIPEAD